MSQEIESRLAKVWEYHEQNRKSPLESWRPVHDLIEEIGTYGKKKKYRDEAVAALREIADFDARFFVWERLAPLLNADDVELLEFLRANLREDRATHPCLEALLKLRGQDVYSDAIDVVCDSNGGPLSRLEALELLSEHSGNAFDKLVDDRYWNNNITDERLPLDVLREWRDGGYGEWSEPPIVIPEAELKQAGIVLPDDYRKFLSKHKGRDRLEYDDEEWDLSTAAQLFERVDIDGTEYPCIGMLAGYVAGMRDAFDDGNTVDAKGKSYSLERLTAGIAFGTSDSGDVLYFDPADGHAVWVFHHDGGDVQKAGKSFTAWRRKTRKA